MNETNNMDRSNLTTQEDQELYQASGPTRIYLSRLVELLSDVADRTTVENAVKQARGFAGGKTKAERREQAEVSPVGAVPFTGEGFQGNYDMPQEDRDVMIEIVEIENPRLPLKFEKTDPRVNFREATGDDAQCRDCVFFKYTGDGDSPDTFGCALVEGRIGHTDTCDLYLSPEEAYNDESDDAMQMHQNGEAVLTEAAARSMHDLIAQDETVVYYAEISREGFSDPEAVPDQIPLLPLPGIYKHPRYGDIVITRERNKRFVENINNKIYQEWIPIDAEHQTKISGAFGWIVGASLNDDGSADANVQWNGRGRQVITENRFRYISPEWMLRYQDPATGEIYEDVVVAAALTTRPFFKEPALRAIVASERGIFDATEQTNGTGEPVIILQMCDPADEVVAHTYERSTQVQKESNQPEHVEEKAAEALQATEVAEEKVEEEAAKEPVQATEKAIDPAEIISNSQVAEQLPESVIEAFTQMQSMMTRANEVIEAKDREVQEFHQLLEASNARIKAMEDERTSQRYSDMVTGRSNEEAHQWFGEPEKHVTMLKSLAEAFGEDSEQFTMYVENQRAIAAQQAESSLFNEVGQQYQSSGSQSSAMQQVEAKARQYMQDFSDQKLTMQQAIARVTDEYPELHDQYLVERGIK